MNPFFCRIGTKKTITDDLIKLIPKHKTFVEAFVGGGALYFAKEPSEIEIINDLDKELIKGYKLLKKISKKNIERAIGISSNVDDIKPIKKRLEVLNEIQNMKAIDDGLKLYQILITTCNTFSSIGIGKIYQPKSNIQKTNKITQYKERLKNTKIFSTDYKKIIAKFDNVDTFFFLDPPYEKSTGLYKNDTLDYEEMANILSNIKGKFMITINESPIIKKIFKNFIIKHIKVKGLGNSDIGNYDRYRQELIITNYKT